MRLVDDLESEFRAGSDHALRAAYEAHGSLVYSCCVRTVGEAMAADVTQEVFISAWRSRHRFDAERGSLAGWLIGITKHRCVDALRHAGRRPAFVGSEDDIASDPPPVHGGDDGEAIRLVIDRMLLADALDELSDRARRSVELVYFEDLSHPEVAAVTGHPLGTVKSDIRRGLARLRRHLEASHV
jgi:RNA polymerase sigma-70 factor (ECF subfamily)